MSGEQLSCPYCLAPIRPHERLAVCSECNLAHHDDCWRDNGECTRYGCNGMPRRMSGQEYLSLAKEDVTPIDLMDEGLDRRYCHHCGRLIKATAIKCKHCKRMLDTGRSTQQQPPAYAQPGPQAPAAYYSPQQSTSPDHQQAVTPKFNWGACLLGPLWYLMHGLWLKAIVIGVISVIAFSIISFLGTIVMGIWAGYMFTADYQRYLRERQQFFW